MRLVASIILLIFLLGCTQKQFPIEKNISGISNMDLPINSSTTSFTNLSNNSSINAPNITNTSSNSSTNTDASTNISSLPSLGRLSNVRSFTYQLQDLDVSQVSKSSFDLVIMDYSKDGSDEEAFSSQEISKLQTSGKYVLAYMSIGEAENYRWYWDEKWDSNQDGLPGVSAPSWLGPSNPEWEGNYKVKYWEPGWKSIIFGTKESYLDKIIDAGFDGVYLDIIDGYEYWGPEGESGAERVTSAREMVNFVKEIAEYARVSRSKPNFIVVPQNGEGLAVYSEYIKNVDGIGKEDLWYDDNDPISKQQTNGSILFLDSFTKAGKTVFVIDYVTEQNKIDDFYSKATDKGYVPYATARDLDVLTVNRGHEPQ